MSQTNTPTPSARHEGLPGLAAVPEDVLPQPDATSQRPRRFIMLGVALLALCLVGLYVRAVSRTNHLALTEAPKPVSVVKAEAAKYRPTRSYVGTTLSWNQANIGPQYISAYVGTVLVRPGASVKRGEVLATLDCRNASAASREIAARAKALEQRRLAATHESERLSEMKKGGFASDNEVEQLGAKASSEAAEVESLKATMASRSLEVDDCILRAPFAGEVAERYVDPGAYVRPGNPVVSVIDRSVVRISADAPETDFAVVAPETPVAIEVEATGARLSAKVSRRSPAADETTRTVHFEVDVPNAVRALPVGATAQMTIEVGQERDAIVVPLRAATIRSKAATVYTVSGSLAKRVVVPIMGERGGSLFLEPKVTVTAGTPVVVEGRALLEDGDQVAMKELTGGAKE